MASAGGFGAGNIAYPARFEEVIAVGGTISSTPESLMWNSNYGEGAELTAPGGDMVDRVGSSFPDLILQQTIYPTMMFPFAGMARPDSFRYVGLGTTTASAAQVTGVIGLMLSHNIPSSSVREILRQTAIDLGPLGYDETFGYGRIDAYKALGGGDTIPPEITETDLLEDAEFKGPFDIWAKISDLFGLYDKRIYYRVGTADWVSLPSATSMYGDRHLFRIPEVEYPSPVIVRYYIKATDNSFNIATAPAGAPTHSYSFAIVPTGVEEENYELGIMNYELTAYPNPSRGKTVISYRLSVIGKNSDPITDYLSPITISIYDLTGRHIRTLPITDHRSPN